MVQCFHDVRGISGFSCGQVPDEGEAMVILRSRRFEVIRTLSNPLAAALATLLRRSGKLA
jgi:hypothetical protein